MHDLNFYEAFNELEQINEDSDKARLARETFWKDYAEYRREQKDAEKQAKLDAENKQQEFAAKKEADVTSLIPTEVLAEYKEVTGKDPQAAIKQYLSQPYISVIRQGKAIDILPSRDSVENIAYAIKSNLQDAIKDTREQAALRDANRINLTDSTKSDDEQRQDIYDYFNKDNKLDIIKKEYPMSEIKIERSDDGEDWHFILTLDHRFPTRGAKWDVLDAAGYSSGKAYAIHFNNISNFNCNRKFGVSYLEARLKNLANRL